MHIIFVPGCCMTAAGAVDKKDDVSLLIVRSIVRNPLRL